MSGSADAIVVGGGSGGYAAALRLAEHGRSVVLVEADKLGGTCLHRGCIPTKTLLHAAETADAVRDATRLGIRSTLEGIDLDAVRASMDDVVSRNHRGLQGLIASRGIEVVTGTGRLVGPGRVDIDGREWTADAVVLAPGSEPAVPQGIALADGRVVTSDGALRLEHLPSSAVVLGGGVVGCEFASAWASLGVAVTVVEAADRLLPAEDEGSCALLARLFRRRRITVRTGTTVDGVTPGPDGVAVRVAGGDPVVADVLLVATGRRPRSAGVGAAEAGVELDEAGYVKVDEYCRTSMDGVYAVGDVIRTPQLAHAGFAEGILAAEQIAGGDPRPIDYDGVPRITYSSPEVASVGLTQREAERRHGADAVRTASYDLTGNPRSAILGTRGAVKVVGRADGTVLGVHLVGDRVGELVAEAQLIVNGAVPAQDVARLIHPHPTQSEAVGEVHLILAGHPFHAH